MIARLKNRVQAGELLAQRLSAYAGQPDVIVLALPRGGVPVGYVVAKNLKLPFDIVLVRKLGVPGRDEYAMGAIAEGGEMIVQSNVLEALNISPATVDVIVAKKLDELSQREKLYRSHRPTLEVSGKTVILVDDGLATGLTMRVAVRAIKKLRPARIVVAVPVGAMDSINLIAGQVDEVICILTPEPFHAVGLWYEDFSQTSDAEVIYLLNQAAH